MNCMHRLRPALAAALLLALGLPLLAAPLSEPAQARAAALEQLFRGEGPSVALGTVYRSLPPPARQQLLAKVREMVLAQLPPGLESAAAIGQLPPELRARLLPVLALLQSVTPEQMDAFVEKQDLDHLAPLPAEVFRAYHEKLTASHGTRIEADRASPDSWRTEAGAAPGYLNPTDPAPAELTLLTATDPVDAAEVPVRKVTPAFGGVGVTAENPIHAPPHVLVNSGRLARALNHLANDGYARTPLQLHAGGKTRPVREGVELVNALLATDRYDVAVFDARMFVDFVGLSVPQGDTLLDVRLPTWFSTPVPIPGSPEGARRTLIMPGNHSEHVLALFEKGRADPVAMVKWYMGIPSAGPAQGTLFKAAVWQKASWSGYRVVRVYQAHDAVRQLVRAGTQLMRLFNFIQGRFQLSRNGYGVLGVCNDTTGLMEGILQGASGLSTVWPLIRDPRLDFYYADAVGRLQLRMMKGKAGTAVLSIPSDARPDHYPWVKDPAVLLYRIGANVPTRDPSELHFPELRGALAALRDSNQAFARGLALQSLDTVR